jgi:hypothetical protein
MVEENGLPARRPLSRTTSLAGTGRNGEDPMRAISGQDLDILGLSDDLKENEDVSILGIQAGCPRLQTRTNRRDRSGRSSVTVKRKRSADTVQLMVGACTPLSAW